MFCSKCGSSLNENNICPICGGNSTPPAPSSGNDNQKIFKILIPSFMVVIIILLSVLLLNDNSTASLKGNDKQDILVESGDVSRTVMIYMIGADLESESAIATSDIASIDPAKVDLDNMDILLYTGGTTYWHNFVSNEENAIYHLTKSGFEKIETYEKLDMGDSETLADFLTYGYDNFKNDRYDLILYNHGGAIQGALYDDFTSDYLSLVDFDEALDASPFNSKNKLETVLFRTCLNGTIEVASIFDDYAYYMVASEEITNGQTNASVLNFLNDIEISDSAIDYGKKYIDAYDKQMQTLLIPLNHPMVYAVIDLSKISELNKAFEKFISSLDLDEHYGDIVRLRESLFQFAYTYYNDGSYDMVDLYSLVKGLDDYSLEKASSVLDIIDEVVVYNWTSNDEFHGLSVYFPYRGATQYKNTFLNIYKKIKDYSNYNTFITNFAKKNSSNEASSFANFTNKSDVDIKDNKEFSISLTDEQVKDYAGSIYILFSKNKEGLYRPVYSSDNATLDNGILKTNIDNNLIKFRDKSDGTEDFITLVERTKNGVKTLTSSGLLQYIPGSNEPLSAMKSTAVNVYFDFENDKPYVTNYVVIGSDGASGAFIKEEDYNLIDYLDTGYKITDKNGKYTDDWDDNGIITGYEIYLKDIEYKKATIDEDEDYYCVFKIQDIYGNSYYSDFMSLN